MAPSFLSKLVKGVASPPTADTTPHAPTTEPTTRRRSLTAGSRDAKKPKPPSTAASTTTAESTPSPSHSRRSSFQVSLSTLTRGSSRNRATSSPPVSKISSNSKEKPPRSSSRTPSLHRKAESVPQEVSGLPITSDTLGTPQPESGRRSRRNSIISSVFGGGKKDKDIVPHTQTRQGPSNGDTSASARNHVAHSHPTSNHDYDGYDSSDDDSIPRIVTVAPTRSRRGSRESFAQSETSTQLGVTIIPPSPLTYAPSLPGSTSTRSSVKEFPAVQAAPAEASSQKSESTSSGQAQREAHAQPVTTPTAATTAFPTAPPSSTASSSSPPPIVTPTQPPQPQTTASVLVSILSGRRRTASISSAISGIIGFGGSKPPEPKESTESPVTPATEANTTPTTASTIKANYFASQQRKGREDIPPVPPLPASVTSRSYSSESSSSTDTKVTNMAPARSQTTLAPAQEGTGVTRETSSRSLTNIPPPIQVPDHTAAAGQAQSQHARAATTPEGFGPHADDTNVTMTPIVESPTMLKHPEFTISPVSVGTASSQGGSARPSSSGGGGGGGSMWLSPKKGQDDDTASIISTSGKDNEGGGKKRLFKRSTSRKPTGLASAIAATGMAMANPSISNAHAAQMTAHVNQQTSPQRSQTEMVPASGSSRSPYMSKSPATSVVSNGGPARSATTVGSPRSVKSSGRKVSSPGAGSKKGKGHPRRPSVSAYSDGAASWTGTTLSVNGGGSEYYSGAESEGARSRISMRSRGRAGSGNDSDSEDDSSDEGTTDSSDDELLDSLSIEQEDIPVTGFAVASNKRNADFHELFPSVPEGDYLIEDYGCALQREILIQGRLYISENHICFHANIFGWITDLAIPIDEVTTLEKKMTAFVIPNAIQVTTRQSRYTFASFLSRDTTYDVIYNIWRLQRPDDARSMRSGRGSMDVPTSASALALGATGSASGPPREGGGGVGGVPKKVARRATQCACGRQGKHYTETAMEATFPGSPEMIHNLMFASGFMKDFMAGEQKLLDIQMSDWAPVESGSNLLQRNMTYIRPLNAPMGPKSTKCEITDVMEHQDFDQYISTVTTTRTPDVPSGGVFSVKTRTCIMWAGPASSKVVVTSQVEWTGRSFIKGIIERSAIDGQKVYHGDLEKAMRVYIQEHHTEFVPEGALEAAAEEAEVAGEDLMREMAEDLHAAEKSAEEVKVEHERQREKERNQRVWQWAWDTCEGAFGVAKNSTKTILDLISDAWDQSSSTTILYFVISILVVSNLYTLIRMGKKEEVGRRKEILKAEERERWVQSVVVTLWDELAAGRMEAVEVRDRFLEQTGRGKAGLDGVKNLPPSVVQSLWASSSSISSDAVPVPTEVPAVQQPVEAVGEAEDRLKLVEESLRATDERLKVVDETLQKTQASLENINMILATFSKHLPVDALD